MNMLLLFSYVHYTVCIQRCYLMYKLQFDSDGLCEAAGDSRLDDVLLHLQNGVDINNTDTVSNYVNYTFLFDIITLCTNIFGKLYG